MSESDKKKYRALKADPARYAAYLDRKRVERKRRGYKASFAAKMARWRAKNPDKAQQLKKAHHAVEEALRTGMLVRPDHCSKCGVACVPNGHHESYEPEHWLDVLWLCVGCHQAIHNSKTR